MGCTPSKVETPVPLADELWEFVFSHLNFIQLRNVRLTCRCFRRLAKPILQRELQKCKNQIEMLVFGLVKPGFSIDGIWFKINPDMYVAIEYLRYKFLVHIFPNPPLNKYHYLNMTTRPRFVCVTRQALCHVLQALFLTHSTTDVWIPQFINFFEALEYD